MFEFANGQVEKRYPDNTQEIKFPDSTTRYIFSNGEEKTIFPDGTEQRTSQNGGKCVNIESTYSSMALFLFLFSNNFFHAADRMIEYPDGRTEVHTSKFKKRQYPDGTVKTVYPDGRQVSFF